MEDFIVRLIKIIIAVVIISATFSGASSTADFDISEYYGFEEIEIIKLDKGIEGLITADFNGDGRNDIAVVNNSKAKIELLIQKEGIGPAEAATIVDPEEVEINLLSPRTRFEKQSIAVAQEIYSFVCGDLNSDGMIDLAFYGDPKGLYVILQKAGDAEPDKTKTINWRTRKKVKIDDGLLTSSALVCADLNNDGANDLALASREAVYIITQKNDGTLAEPIKYPSAARILGLKASDLNGDNINDLILITAEREKPIHLRFGLETGQLGPEVEFFIEKPSVLDVYDVDGLAGDEILTIDSISRRLSCYKFTAETEKDADWPILFYPLASGKADTKRDLVVADFDGDGLADVTISEPGAAELIFYKQTAGIGLSEPRRFPAFADITNLSVADIDRNGKAEVAVLSVKEKVIGISKFENERLTFPKPVEVTGEPVAMKLADVDSSGSIDCLYISRNTDDVRFLRAVYNLAASPAPKPVKTEPNQPDESVTDFSDEFREEGPALELKKLTSNPEGLKVLDVDQDGLQDVLIFVKYDDPILVRQSEKRQFELIDSPKAQASLIKDASLRSIAAANVDGKVGKEMLLAQKNFARSLVFSEGKRWSIIDQYNAKNKENKISAVAAFNIDADAAAENPTILLLDGLKGQLQILKAGEDGTYRLEKVVDIGKWSEAAHLKMLFTPLTGRGGKSMLLFDSEKFALVTPPSSSNIPQRFEKQFSYETKIKDGVYGNLTAGDINSDGKVDIIMVEYKRGEYEDYHIEILTLDSESEPIPAMQFRIFEEKTYRGRSRRAPVIEPRELKIADVTGDGKSDLVTIIHDRIIIYPQG